MKKSDLIRANIENFKKDAENLVNKEGVTAEELTEINNKITAEKKKLEVQLTLEEEIRNSAVGEPLVPVAVVGTPTIKAEERNKIIARALIGKASNEELVEIKNLLQEGEAGKGGLLVPSDIRTKIIELQRNKFDIRKYINIEPTIVDKGSRVKEKNEPQASGFASVDEGKEIQALHEPEVEPVDYAIRKYAGYIPITNELLEDSPENILKYILGWMSKNELNTYNYQVFNGSGVKAAEGILNEIGVGGKLETRVTFLEHAPTIQDFKNAINIGLEEVSTDNIQMFVNGNGYSHIDNMEDNMGRPLLQPDVTKGTGLSFTGKEMVKVPTKFLGQVIKDGKTYTPYVIGDLELLYTLYDREQLVIESTKIGGQAWRTDTTEVKGTFRFDGKINGDIKSVIIILANHDGTPVQQTLSRAGKQDNNAMTVQLATVIEGNNKALGELKGAIVDVLNQNKAVEDPDLKTVLEEGKNNGK